MAENSTVTSWSGTAINAAIMEYSCEYNVIDLLHTRFYENVSITCGSKALVAQSIGVAMSPSNSCFTSELILKAFLGLDGKAIDCSLSAGFKEVGQSSVMIAGRCVLVCTIIIANRFSLTCMHLVVVSTYVCIQVHYNYT